MGKTEIQHYTVLESSGSIELRNMSPMVIAECDVKGERKEAIREGFRILARFIFGANNSNTQIAMTAPVTQQAQQKSGSWTIRFNMPSSYTNLDQVPQPTDSRIRIVSMPERKFVVIRFSGMTSQKNLTKNYDKLTAYIKTKGLKTVHEPIYAFYNPPWTLPFLRRNEILVELACKESA